MVGRIATLMLRIRDTLADPDGARWSNDRLLRLIDEGQKDIAKHAKLLRTKVDVAILPDISTYQLPSDAFIITRVIGTDGVTDDLTTPKQVLPIKSHAQMDEIDVDWESATSDGIEYIVFDKLNPGYFKAYPIPSLPDTAEDFSTTSDLGVLTDSTTDTTSTPFGVSTDVTKTDVLKVTFSSGLGVVTDMLSIITSLTVYYLQRPGTLDDYSRIDTAGQELTINEEFDKALKHYVIGMALRDDMDTQNRTIGNEELLFYTRELDVAKADSSTDFMQASQHDLKYNPGI